MAKNESILQLLTGTEEAKMRVLMQARVSFWQYCKLMNPSFFRDDRTHLKELADTLQAFGERRLVAPNGKPCRKLAISEPPRHGKSYTMTLYTQWRMGKQPDKTRVISTSYNETLASRFSKGVRDGIDATAIDKRIITFSDVFPGVRIKEGDAAAQLWSLEGSHFSFLGAGFGGTITGIGCSLLTVDDPIKNHLEASNERLLDEQWRYYTDTLLSRVEEDGEIILIMTRWALGDLVGRATAAEPGEWVELRQPACLDEGKGVMLCPSLLSFDSYIAKKRVTSPEILLANYQQQPVDIQGRLYDRFATYDALPDSGAGICYVDTADTGADYLCAVAARRHEGEGYVQEVIYTDAPMEKTEVLVADMLYQLKTDTCVIESNNGGRGFARNVERLLWERHEWRRTRIIQKPQRQNKQARILTEAGYVMEHIKYPEGWQDLWPQYAAAMRTYQRKGRNAHDDAPDATTGLAETLQGRLARKRKSLI